jgi:phosphohistidine phosphatase
MLDFSQQDWSGSVNLILWRHAEAHDGLPDMDRQLTDKGHRQAALVAAWLKPRLPRDVRVLSSPATRARQTADALAMDYTIVKEMAPGADAAHFLAAVGWPSQGGSVVAVGHQPTLGNVASLLVAGEESSFSMKKGAIFWISRREREARLENVVRAVLSPELLKE